MQVKLAEVAKALGSTPDAVETALAGVGIEVTNGSFEADDDVLELIGEELGANPHQIAAAKALLRGGGKTVALPHGRTPRDIAGAIGVPDKEVLTTLIKVFKQMKTLTMVLEDDLTEKLCKEFGFSVVWESAQPQPKPAAAPKAHAPASGKTMRPPVVTIMGHVDHGKTSLLDYIRKSNVVAKEHGGITQHIGAYQVQLPEGTITFLDTPGHAAFTAMRARGAQVTDIAILVVAADDGIMPQTIEAIAHAKNADVPIIVAVNKIDKAGANPDRVLQQLTQHDLVPEAYGGQVITANVSALTGEGVPQLLELILLQAEVLELKADPKGEFEGVVIEAKLEKGRGPVATVLVQEGTLHIGDVVTVGSTYGKLKAMTDWAGNRITTAGPSTPVEILGLNEVPPAGEKVEVAENEKVGREQAEQRSQAERLQSLAPVKRKVTLREIRKQLDNDELKDLNLIVRADVQGSVEAVRGLLDKLESPEVVVKVKHAGVGPVTESDVLLAGASDAIIVGFNVKAEPKAKSEAERQKVEIRTYTIIYELIEDIEAALKGMLAPKFEEEYQGTVEIRAVFKLSRSGKVAGSHCTDGKITRNSKVRVRRDKDVVFEGELDSLKNVKQDVREIIAGQDCGIKFQGWEDFLEGDVIEAYELVQVN